MSVFDEELTIEKLKELGFKLGDNTLYKTIKCEYLYGPEVTIFYFINRIEDNVETIFLSTNFTKHFYDTAKDIIDMTTLIHRAKEMLKENMDNPYQFSNNYMNLT